MYCHQGQLCCQSFTGNDEIRDATMHICTSLWTRLMAWQEQPELRLGTMINAEHVPCSKLRHA